jgi:hypothetical protein
MQAPEGTNIASSREVLLSFFTRRPLPHTTHLPTPDQLALGSVPVALASTESARLGRRMWTAHGVDFDLGIPEQLRTDIRARLPGGEAHVEM